jgi:hypothetical protein
MIVASVLYPVEVSIARYVGLFGEALYKARE